MTNIEEVRDGNSGVDEDEKAAASSKNKVATTTHRVGSALAAPSSTATRAKLRPMAGASPMAGARREESESEAMDRTGREEAARADMRRRFELIRYYESCRDNYVLYSTGNRDPLKKVSIETKLRNLAAETRTMIANGTPYDETKLPRSFITAPLSPAPGS